MSHSLEPIHKEIKTQIQASTVIHLDETGHKECYQNGWAWIMSTQDCSHGSNTPAGFGSTDLKFFSKKLQSLMKGGMCGAF